MKRADTPAITADAVVQVKDGFLRRPIDEDPVAFELDGLPFEPVRKAQGFYVFTNLGDVLPHELKVSCGGFFDAKLPLLPMRGALAEAIQICDLQPSPDYAYPADTTIVRGRVTHGGEGIDDVLVVAVLGAQRGATRAVNGGGYAIALYPTTESADLYLRFVKDGFPTVEACVRIVKGETTTADDCEM